MKLVLATGNAGKIREIRQVLDSLPLEILTLADFPGCPESEEPHATYLENAREKAKMVSEFTGLPALADDTGLEVEFLKGAPGVLSARYAGPQVKAKDNMQKLLAELQGLAFEKRNAVFRCCLVLYFPDGREEVFEGDLPGKITEAPVGNQGFGYDPIFWIPEFQKTLAELSFEEKTQVSHRARAVETLKKFLISGNSFGL